MNAVIVTSAFVCSGVDTARNAASILQSHTRPIHHAKARQDPLPSHKNNSAACNHLVPVLWSVGSVHTPSPATANTSLLFSNAEVPVVLTLY